MDFAPGTFERNLLDHALHMGADETSAAACLSHPLDHECDGCRAIRREGPRAYGSPIRRLMADAQGDLVTETPAPKTPAERRARAGWVKRQIKLSDANRRGIPRLAAALAGKRTRNRKGREIL